MFLKVMATFLKIVLFDFKRYCIWLEDALYVAGTVCATCFFIPEVLYLVRYEMALWIKNAYLHVGKTLMIKMKRYIFKRSGFLQRNATYWKGILILLKECYTLWMNVFVCKACSCHLELVELVLQEKDACLIVSCSHLHVFTVFSGLRKGPKIEWSVSGLNHYWRETLQRGWGTWRYVNYT